MCIAVDIIGFRNFVFRIKSQETGQFFTVSLRPFIYVENKIFPYAVTLTNTQRNVLCGRNISGLICNYTEAIS
jgi:hypothetical protein